MKKNNVRSDLEWFETIRECRSSGLSERKWCEANGISHNSLHYYIKKLRGRGYDIPQPSRVSGNGPRQEVVPSQSVVGVTDLPEAILQLREAGRSPRMSS